MSVSPLDLQEHLNDYDWLDDHLDQVYIQIARGLNGRSASAVEAIETLNLIMPYALTRADYKRWENVLYDALLCAMDLSNTDFQIQVWSHLGACLFQSGNYQTASDAFSKALARTDRNVTIENRLLARIGILHSKAIFATQDIDQFIAETLIFAREIANDRMLATLHYSLAVAYLHQAETRRALGHAQVALSHWMWLENHEEQQRTALLLAEICRVARSFPHAAHFLELVKPGAKDAYHSAILNYHQASVLLENKQHQAAVDRYADALEGFMSLDFPYMTGAAHHALALAQTKVGDITSARHHLRQALIIWQKLEIEFQQANGVYALGFLEAIAENHETARGFYQQALQMAESLPDSPLVSDLCADIREDMDKLPPL